MSGSGPWKRPPGHHRFICYPVDGECFVELYFGEQQWADVTIGGIHHDLVGEARVADASFTVTFWEPVRDEGQAPLSLDLADVMAALEKAKNDLLENERGVEPLLDTEGMTRAGSAFSKMSADTQRSAMEAVQKPGDLGPDH